MQGYRERAIPCAHPRRLRLATTVGGSSSSAIRITRAKRALRPPPVPLGFIAGGAQHFVLSEVGAVTKPSSAWKEIGIWTGAPILSSGLGALLAQWRTIVRSTSAFSRWR